MCVSLGEHVMHAVTLYWQLVPIYWQRVVTMYMHVHLALFPKCKFPHLGKDWTDLDDLIAHCNIQAFLLQSSMPHDPAH